MQLARTTALPVVCWVCPIAQIMVLGRFLAMISAQLRTSSSAMPVTTLTACGVHFFASSRTLSMP